MCESEQDGVQKGTDVTFIRIGEFPLMSMGIGPGLKKAAKWMFSWAAFSRLRSPVCLSQT